MKEKTLDAQQSLELISRMIQSTRNRLERNTGRPFLIWGYTTVAISLFNYFIRVSDMNPSWSFTWFLIPVIGWLLMRFIPNKKTAEPRTEIDRIVRAVWLTVSIALVPALIFCIYHSFRYEADLFALITLLMGLATAITGLIVRSKIYAVAGFAGMALSTLFVIYNYYLARLSMEQLQDHQQMLSVQMFFLPILLFAAIFVVMMVIPGHVMNRQSRRRCSEN